MFRHFCLPISNGNNAKKTNQETFHTTIAIVWIIDSEKRNDRLISTYYCHEIFGRYNLYLYRFIKKEKIFASNYCEKYSEEFSNECTYMRVERLSYLIGNHLANKKKEKEIPLPMILLFKIIFFFKK